MKSTILLIAACAVVATHAEQDKRISIAVNDLAGQGIDQPTSATISERLRVELINTQAFRVMERSQMANILQEQGFQQTDCVDNSCIVQMGQLLGVEHMVMGTIGKVGSMYTISLRMVNVATGEVLYTASEDCRCEIEDVLTQSTPRIAMKLELAVEKAIFGTLNVKTVPESANVLINNNKIGVTNYFNDRFVPGKYQLSVQKPTYNPLTQNIEVERNKVDSLTFKLEHTTAFLDSVKKATKHERFRAKFARQMVLGCLAAGFGATGYYFNTRAQKSIDRENQAKENYLAAEEGADFVSLYNAYQKAGNDAEKPVVTRDIFYGVAGAFVLSFGISFAF